MSVVYIKRLSPEECTQIISCTPLSLNSAITVKLVCVHFTHSDFWILSDRILQQVLSMMKKHFPFVCVQSCSYNYNVVYRITFLTSSPFTFVKILNGITKNISSPIVFYFD